MSLSDQFGHMASLIMSVQQQLEHSEQQKSTDIGQILLGRRSDNNMLISEEQQKVPLASPGSIGEQQAHETPVRPPAPARMGATNQKGSKLGKRASPQGPGQGKAYQQMVPRFPAVREAVRIKAQALSREKEVIAQLSDSQNEAGVKENALPGLHQELQQDASKAAAEKAAGAQQAQETQAKSGSAQPKESPATPVSASIASREATPGEEPQTPVHTPVKLTLEELRQRAVAAAKQHRRALKAARSNKSQESSPAKPADVSGNAKAGLADSRLPNADPSPSATREARQPSADALKPGKEGSQTKESRQEEAQLPWKASTSNQPAKDQIEGQDSQARAIHEESAREAALGKERASKRQRTEAPALPTSLPMPEDLPLPPDSKTLASSSRQTSKSRKEAGRREQSPVSASKHRSTGGSSRRGSPASPRSFLRRRSRSQSRSPSRRRRGRSRYSSTPEDRKIAKLPRRRSPLTSPSRHRGTSADRKQGNV